MGLFAPPARAGGGHCRHTHQFVRESRSPRMLRRLGRQVHTPARGRTTCWGPPAGGWMSATAFHSTACSHCPSCPTAEKSRPAAREHAAAAAAGVALVPVDHPDHRITGKILGAKGSDALLEVFVAEEDRVSSYS